MITQADVKKLKTIFATKDELSDVSEELVNLMHELKENLVNFKDSILNEIIKIREDITVVTGYRGLIEDHDKRIEKLETTVYH